MNIHEEFRDGSVHSIKKDLSKRGPQYLGKNYLKSYTKYCVNYP